MPEIIQNSQTSEPIDAPQENNNQKSARKIFLLIALCFILLLIVVLIGVIFINTSKSTPVPVAQEKNTSPNVLVDETADWQTYNGYGFAIKYPNKYDISDKIGTNLAPALVAETVPAQVVFDAYENRNNLSLEDWVKSDLVIHDLSIAWEHLSVNGVNSLRSPIRGNIDGGLEFSALIPGGAIIYAVTFSTKAPNTESELKVFGSILSTFRLIGTADVDIATTSDW